MPNRQNTIVINDEKKGLAVAIPSSILDTQHKPILKTYLVGQISRALAVFRVSEIVIFNEVAAWEPKEDELFSSQKQWQSNTAFIARNLLLTECPQWLRIAMFPLHNDTRDCGALPPLMLPSHPLSTERPKYREAVVVADEQKPDDAQSHFVNCGLSQPVKLDQELPLGIRVTVKMNESDYESEQPTGEPVSVSEAKASGTYWGYSVRTAGSLSAAIGVDRYDLVVGTSERGVDCSSPSLRIPKPHYRPLLVLGGPKGLEECIANDPAISNCYPEDVFHTWVNALPNQGSKTIRTEEALIMCLSRLQDKIDW
eukprot:TRINITY_DN7156_c0_g1_i1.p1 TRINITY_DN7156_c0_g1~~TRINITY_DN7156_c0_g1_i1.p1  ORF type:complete len:312 (+),score=59.42 TRINITY_DN7156_c0_g1_i1:84-1019(+)